MSRLVVGTLAISALVVSSAPAASDQVSVALLPGPGLVLSGAPVLQEGPAGTTLLSLEDVEVRDTTGSGGRWTLDADVALQAGDERWSLRLGGEGPAQAVLPGNVRATVTLTAGPAV